MKRAFAVAGLMFGDEGKGATVDYLTRKYDARLIVRYNGGPQTAHNVVTPEGIHHTFSQFGSGMLAHPDVKTFLSRFMLVNPLTMAREAEVLGQSHRPYERTYVDSMALVVTPYHRAMNRIREYERSKSREIHGSCGMGIGECRKYFMDYGLDAVFVGDLRNEHILYAKLKKMRSRLAASALLLLPLKDVPPDLDEIYDLLITIQGPPFIEHYLDWAKRMDERIVGSSRLESLLHGDDTVIFEGAQGVLLDEAHGTYPHNTWTDTTFNNADTLLREMRFDGEVTKIGCVRTSATRHGAGPFPTEDISAAWPLEAHNSDYGCAGRFRQGHFDAAAVRYALASCIDTPAVDYLAVSHFDALNHMDVFQMCTEYDNQKKPVYKGFLRPASTKEAWWSVVREAIERYTYTPVGLTAWGPTANDRMEIHGNNDGYRRRAIYTLPWVPRGVERPSSDRESVCAGKG